MTLRATVVAEPLPVPDELRPRLRCAMVGSLQPTWREVIDARGASTLWEFNPDVHTVTPTFGAHTALATGGPLPIGASLGGRTSVRFEASTPFVAASGVDFGDVAIIETFFATHRAPLKDDVATRIPICEIIGADGLNLRFAYGDGTENVPISTGWVTWQSSGGDDPTEWTLAGSLALGAVHHVMIAVGSRDGNVDAWLAYQGDYSYEGAFSGVKSGYIRVGGQATNEALASGRRRPIFDVFALALYDEWVAPEYARLHYEAAQAPADAPRTVLGGDAGFIGWPQGWSLGVVSLTSERAFSVAVVWAGSAVIAGTSTQALVSTVTSTRGGGFEFGVFQAGGTNNMLYVNEVNSRGTSGNPGQVSGFGQTNATSLRYLPGSGLLGTGIHRAVYTHTASGMALFYGGTLVASAAEVTSWSVPSTLHVGRFTNGHAVFSGHVHCLLAFDGALTPAEVSRLDDTLASRYG